MRSSCRHRKNWTRWACSSSFRLHVHAQVDYEHFPPVFTALLDADHRPQRTRRSEPESGGRESAGYFPQEYSEHRIVGQRGGRRQ